MATKKLRITVAGQAACGKTTVAQLIRCLLTDAGIQVKILNDHDIPPEARVPDMPQEMILRNLMAMQNVEVEIEQVHLSRLSAEG